MDFFGNLSAWAPDRMQLGTGSQYMNPAKMDWARENLLPQYQPSGLAALMQPQISDEQKLQQMYETAMQDRPGGVMGVTQKPSLDDWLLQQANQQQLNPESTWAGNSVMPGIGGRGLQGRANEYYKQSLPEELRYLADLKIADKSHGGGDVSALSGQVGDWVNRGLNLGNKAGSTEEQIARLAPDLARYGVNSLDDIQAIQVPSLSGQGNQTVFLNKNTNEIIPTRFGSDMGGKGGSEYYLANVGGHAVPVSKWRDTSDRQEILGALSVLSMAAGPLLAPYAASAATSLSAATGMSQAAANALVQAGMQGLKGGVMAGVGGGNILQGLASGALNSGLGSTIGLTNPGSMVSDNSVISNAINSGLKGAGSGGLNSLIYGGDFGSGLTSGFTNSGLKSLISGGLNEAGVPGAISNQLARYGTKRLMGG